MAISSLILATMIMLCEPVWLYLVCCNNPCTIYLLATHLSFREVPKISEDAIAVDSPQVKPVSTDQEEKTTVKKVGLDVMDSISQALVLVWSYSPAAFSP